MTAIDRCLALARFSEDPHAITRTFLSPPMRDVHRTLRAWMEPLGMRVWVDGAGNLHGLYPGTGPRRWLIGSHVDTVPVAGAFDGILGVAIAIAIVERLGGRRLPHAIEIVAFSDEEGVRFGVPFIGSRALTGTLDSELLAARDKQGVTVAQAIRDFGLDPDTIPQAAVDPSEVAGYLEFHIEQGPVLESLDLPLGIVTAINGLSRYEIVFRGKANHAGTTPMDLRQDALPAAAEWILEVERIGKSTAGLVGTVGRIAATPGAANVIAGEVRVSLDVRHSLDDVRSSVVAGLLNSANAIAARRSLEVSVAPLLDQPAIPCSDALTRTLESSILKCGYPVHRMGSGAGHDAMILAKRVPAAMLFLRSPGGISHHPEETVLPEDVEAAIQVGREWVTL